MVGSPGIGAVVSQVTFWSLLVTGIVNGALTKRGAAIFVLLWAAGYIGLSRIAWWTGPLATSWVAVLDIVLVFIVFKGDVTLT
jgi:hypothetical protein